jgi:hypothetical protein
MGKDILIREVSNKKELKAFVKFQSELYKESKYYVPPIVSMEMKMLSFQNPMTRNCEFKLWLAYQEEQIIGRIACIVNHNYNEKEQEKQARFTHFDFINDYQVSASLLNTAIQWSKAKNMEYMIGPFGFTNLDKHGLLVEGHDQLACQSSNYNAEYYQDHIEKFGFNKKHDWVERKVIIPSQKPEKLEKFAKLLSQKYELNTVDLRNKNSLKKYASKVFELYNRSYTKLYGVSPLDKAQKNYLLNNFIPYLHPDFTSIIVNKEDQVVAFGIAMPSLSKTLQKIKGRIFPFGFYHLYQNRKNNPILDLLLIGIDEEYQKKGLNAILFNDISDGVFKHGIQYLETTQNLESNKDVQNLWSSYESTLHKRARLYRKEL